MKRGAGMANKRTRAINREEFEKIIETIRTGFILPNGECVRPNVRIAAALILEANLGLRIGDIVRLRLADILFESGRYHLNIIEQKNREIAYIHGTGRHLYIPAAVCHSKRIKGYTTIVPYYGACGSAAFAKGMSIPKSYWGRDAFVS